MAIIGEALARTVRDFVAAVGDPMPVTRSELQAAITAADTWIDDNAVSFNNALPQPFRGVATASWKTMLLVYVALRRAGK